MILLLKMKDRRECVDIPDMTLLLKIKRSVANILRLIGKLFWITGFLPLLTFIGDKFSRVEKLLIISSILTCQMSNSQNGLLQYTSIGDKFCRFEKLLIRSRI